MVACEAIVLVDVLCRAVIFANRDNLVSFNVGVGHR